MRIRWAAIILLMFSFAWSLVYLTGDWDRSLLGLHEFRQTQTALTSYWFVHEGFRIDYQTPVLGPPWSIPFEFPFYQALVALIAIVTRLPLDALGRAVSVTFALAALWPLERILRWWIPEWIQRALVLLTIWTTPINLYWSNSFLIESTALCFCLLFLYWAVEFVRKGSNTLAVLALIAGTVGALQKITVFVIVAAPAIALAGKALVQSEPASRYRKLAWFTGCLFLPLLVTVAWTHYADGLKSINPLATGITSQALTTFNFGTLQQKESIQVWKHILSLDVNWGLAHGRWILAIGIFLVIVLAIFRSNYRYEILALLSGYFAAPLVFTNLFFVHEYYHYENLPFLGLAFGLSVYSLVHSVSNSERTQLAVTGLCLISLSAFALRDYRIIWGIRCAIPTSVKVTRELQPLTDAVAKNEVILIFGRQWNPSLAYYSERKAIINYENLPLDNRAFGASINLLSSHERVAALIVNYDAETSTESISEGLRLFHLSSVPITIRWGKAYLKADP